MGFIAIFPTFISWWYSKGLGDLFLFLKLLYKEIANFFSVGEIMKTFFAPWKRLVSPKGRGLEGFESWLLDNLVSRGVGVVVRLMLILVFCLTSLLYLIFAALSLVFWLGLPLIILFSFLYLFMGYR